MSVPDGYIRSGLEAGSSLGEVLAMRASGPEFDPSIHIKNNIKNKNKMGIAVRAYNPYPEVGRERRVSGACWSSQLVSSGLVRD